MSQDFRDAPVFQLSLDLMFHLLSKSLYEQAERQFFFAPIENWDRYIAGALFAEKSAFMRTMFNSLMQDIRKHKEAPDFHSLLLLAYQMRDRDEDWTHLFDKENF